MLSLETEIAVDFLKTRFFPIYSLFLRTLSSCFYIIDQNKRRRVQREDSAILRMNLYLLDNATCFPDTYPLDSDLSGGWRYPSGFSCSKRWTVNSTVRRINLYSVVNTIGSVSFAGWFILWIALSNVWTTGACWATDDSSRAYVPYKRNRPFPHSCKQRHQVEPRVDNIQWFVWNCPPEPQPHFFVFAHWSGMQERSVECIMM